MASAFNTTTVPAISLQRQLTAGNPSEWWLPASLRHSGVWTDASFSRDDAGSFTLGLLFCGAVGLLFGAGEPSQLGMPVLPSEERQAAARESVPRLVVTDQASVRAGAQTLGEQQERQRLLVKKDRARLAVLEAAMRSEREGLDDRVAAWGAAQEQYAANNPGATTTMRLWRETPTEYRQRLLDASVRREQRAAWLRLTLRAEEEVLAELTRLAADRGVEGPPVQPGIF